MVLKVCGFVMFSLVSEWPIRQYQAHLLIHFSLANMVGRTPRTLPFAAVSGGRAHRGWQAQRDFKRTDPASAFAESRVTRVARLTDSIYAVIHDSNRH